MSRNNVTKIDEFDDEFVDGTTNSFKSLTPLMIYEYVKCRAVRRTVTQQQIIDYLLVRYGLRLNRQAVGRTLRTLALYDDCVQFVNGSVIYEPEAGYEPASGSCHLWAA